MLVSIERRFKMRRRVAMFLALLVALMTLGVSTVFAAGADITSYAFADIAGSINGTTITVNVPYSTVTTYWNHKVQVSSGATFQAGTIQKVDDRMSSGKITVIGADGTKKEYTVNIYKNDFVEPVYSLSKAKSIRKNSAEFDVVFEPNDAQIRQIRLVFYEKKTASNYRGLDSKQTGQYEVELTGLKAGTKYTCYLEIETDGKTYTTSGKSFTTKKETDQGTSTSSSSSSSSSSSTSSKGTNSQGSNTTAKENKSKVNQWSLENGKWYYYGADGFNKTGWFQVGDIWYWAEKGTNELAMDTWKNLDKKWYYFDPSGAMTANGWALVNNTWYWMGESGSMTQSQDITVNNVQYSIAPDGTCVDGKWFVENGRWKYYKAGAAGLAKNEQFVVDGIQYNADASGYVN